MTQMPESLAVTLEVVKAFGPPIIAGLVGVVAWRQWRTARNKLALDLFDRRLAAWTTIQAALDTRRQEIRDTHQRTGQQALERSKTLTDLWSSLSVAHFLFGDDVREAFHDVDEAMYSYAMTHPADEDDESHPGLKIMMTSHAVKRVLRERAKLERVVEPYMMLDRIGITKPARKARKKVKAFVSRPR